MDKDTVSIIWKGLIIGKQKKIRFYLYTEDVGGLAWVLFQKWILKCSSNGTRYGLSMGL